MTAKWPVRKERAASFVEKSIIHPVLCNPARSLLVVLGIVLFMASMQTHAYTPVSASLTQSEVFLQPGSEISSTVSVYFPLQWDNASTAHIEFDVQTPEGITIDGQLNPVDTPISISRNFVVRASNTIPQGTYSATLNVRTILDNFEQTIPLPITIQIGPKTHFLYQTTDYSTLAPTIGNVDISPSSLALTRVDTGSFEVSFTHFGSTTDYLIRLAEPVLSAKVSFANATHRFVEDGDTVTSFMEVTTTPYTPFGVFPLRIEAYDLATGQKTFLGSVYVDVTETTNVLSSLASHFFEVPANGSVSTILTLKNTEYNDTELILESNLFSIVFDSRIVKVPAQSTLDVNVTIFGNDVPSVENGTIYVVHPSFTDEVHFSIETVESDVDANGSFGGLGSPIGLATGTGSSILGGIVVVFALLLLVSKGFRARVVSYLPKAPVPEKKG